MRGIAAKIATIVCAAGLTFVVFAILVPALLGLQRYVITGGSMTGAIPKGSVIYSKITPVEQLKAGDIITFHPPGGSMAVTHRITAVGTDSSGARVFSTKGDFNEAPDPWNPIKLNEPRQARYLFHIPLFGYALAALAQRSFRLALIGLPAMIIALSLLWSLWSEAGVVVDKQSGDAGDALPHDAASRA